jgi:Ca-activated chloride channel homolog
MNRPLASCLVLVSLFSSLTVAQTKAKKQRVERPTSSGDLKICQGVSLPNGYIIVGYVTSPACPHGAYLLRKQAPAQVSAAAATTAAVANVRQPEPPQTKASRPRRVQSAPALTAPTLKGPRESIATPNAVALNSTPPAVPEPSVEEVSAGDVVRIDTNFVTVPVSVLDRQGRFISGLQREDFKVFENGVEQPIAFFEPTEKPFTVALVLDTSASTRFHLWQIKEAAIAFAKQLRPQDRVLVVTFSDEVLLLTEATNDANLVSTVIQVNANTGNSTRLYDAVNLVIAERLDKIQGRKAIVLFTDGVDTSSYMSTYESTMREAEELDALIYPIQYDTTDYMRAMQGGGSVTVTTSRSNWPFGNGTSQTTQNVPGTGVPISGATQADYDRADQYLKAMADKTGGRLYRANDATQLAQAFTSIAEELRRQYSLGYYPQNGTAVTDERRQIKVSVKRPNVAVRARNSYMRSSSTPAP